jgi:hypothetical protein
MTLEFIKDEIFFFATYNRSGQRTEYRREYISLKIRPYSESNLYFTSFNQTQFENFVWVTPTQLRVNMTTVKNLTLELVFEFNSTRLSTASGHPAVKFSFIFYSAL